MSGKTRHSNKASKRGHGVHVAVVAVIVCLFTFVVMLASLGFIDSSTKQQGAYTLRESIMDAMVQCYAIEGQYPASLEYIEENYGVSVNRDDYDVVYNVYASNVPPTVEVRVK